MINTINKEFSKFIKKIEKNQSSIQDEEINLSPDSILYEFFGEDVRKYESPHGDIKQVITNNMSGYMDGRTEYFDMTLIEMRDGTFAYGTETEQFSDLTISPNLTKKIQSNHLKYISRKHPVIYKSLLEEDLESFSIDDLDTVFQDIMDIKNSISGMTYGELNGFITNMDLRKRLLIKNIKKDDPANVLDFIKNLDSEDMSDFAAHLVEISRVAKIIKRMKDDSTSHLITSETTNLITEVVRLDITPSEFRASFSSKIKKYKTPEEFNAGLKKYINGWSGWSIESWENKLKNLNIKSTKVNEDTLLIETKSYEEMNKIGSTQWCIATNERHYLDYTKDYRRQFMLCDFNLDIEDPMSMIGVTVDMNGNPTAAHNKNDNNIAVEINRKAIQLMVGNYSEKDFSERIILDRHRNKKEGMTDPDNVVEIKDFKQYTKYNMVNNEDYKNIEKIIISKIEKAINVAKDNDELSEIFEECLEKMITFSYASPGNNVTHVFNLLNDCFDNISEIYKFNSKNGKANTGELIAKDDGVNFLTMVSKSSAHTMVNYWDLLNGSVNDEKMAFLVNYSQVNKELSHSKFEEWMGSDVEQACMIFDDDGFFNDFKDLSIMEITFKQLSVIIEENGYPRTSTQGLNNMKSFFKKMGPEKQEKIIDECLNKSIYSIQFLMYLVDEKLLKENVLLNAVSKLKKMEDVHELNDTYFLEDISLTHKTFKKAIKLMEKNVVGFSDDIAAKLILKSIKDKKAQSKQNIPY
jgi:hypothetical protein